MTVYAELSEDEKRIEIYFRYDLESNIKMRQIHGSKFIDRSKGGPFWTAPLEWDSALELRHQFERDLVIGDNFQAWAWRERKRNESLSRITSAQEVDLSVLPEILPELSVFLRPDQTVGAAFVAASEGCLIADQAGLGKTVEVIAGIYEGRAHEGPNLIIGPSVSLESVWLEELERWQDLPVWVPLGNRKRREAIIEDFRNYNENFGDGFLVVNPQMVAFRRQAPICQHCERPMQRGERKDFYYCKEDAQYSPPDLVQSYSFLGEIEWQNIVIDECHKNAVRNPSTLTAQAMFKLQLVEGGKKIAMSGTPIFNKPIDLWGVLHWLFPLRYPAKWRWAERWLEVEDNRYGKKIKGIRPGLEDEFQKSLTPVMLRRTKEEVMPWLPPKTPIDLWVDMTSAQEKQYVVFAKKAAIRIEEEDLTATEKLTEYLRLKQFAIAEQELRKEGEKVVPYPTFESGKLLAVEELLDERGIFEEVCDEKVVVFSQFERVVNMVSAWLEKKGVEHLKLVGKTKDKLGVQKQFQMPGGPRAVVMTTQTGGISITLDRADTAIFTDETWTESEMEQAEDRLHRASRKHNVTCIRIRSRKSIDQYIMDLVGAKGAEAKDILDERRKLRLY